MATGIPLSHSVSSVDLSDDFPPCSEFPSLISEPFTVESVSAAEVFDTIPPFDPERRPPIATIVNLSSGLPMFPCGLRRLGELSVIDDAARASITIPTAPRLRSLLEENLCVRRWTESLSVLEPPGHIPWGTVEGVPASPWIPEGSSYPPEEFQETLRNKHKLRGLNAWKLYVPPVTQALYPVNHSTNQRPLAFEQEIKVKRGDQSKNLSLHVPTVTMDPEIVDMVLELKNLNSFFRDGLEDPEMLLKSVRQGKPKLVPPALVVSNSESSVPILFNSAGDPPLALAARRGKVTPPALSLGEDADRGSYSSIPTAFLGSPSSYSPKFQFANPVGQPTMAFEDMVASLTSQSVSLQDRLSCLEQKTADAILAHPNVESPSVDEDDEWCFARSLLETHGDSLSKLSSQLSSFISLSPHDIPLKSSVESDSESLVDTPGQISEATTEPSSPAVKPPNAQHSSSSLGPSQISPSSAPPVLALTTSPKLMRGILKNCKSVRFASLPSRREALPGLTKSPWVVSGRLTGTSSLRRPSPLRNCYSPQDNAPSESAHSAAASSSSSAPRAPRPPRRKSVPRQMTSSMGEASTPSAPEKPLVTNLSFRRPPGNQVLSPGTKRAERTTSSLGRRSFGGLAALNPTRGKENKAPWSTLDENALRRGGLTRQRNDGEPSKSRMPTPLRSIFTRFK